MCHSNEIKNLSLKILNNFNCSLRYFSSISGISKSTLSRWKNEKENGKDDKRKNGNNTKYDKTRILKFIKNSIEQNPHKSLLEIKQTIKKKLNINLSKTTLSRYMKILGYTKKKIKVTYLSKKSLKNMKQRTKEFKKIIKNIKIENIICLDESYINPKIYSNYGWSKINENIKKL